MTAAQAVGAAGATGAGGGAGGSGAATGGAAAGGGVSGTTIGIVGAAAAAVGGGAIIATQVAGGGGKRELAGNVTMEMTLVFVACTRVERYTGLVAIESADLDADPMNGTATIEDGRMTVLSATRDCVTGPQTGQSFPWGMNATPASGPAANITFTYHRERALKRPE